MLDVLNRSNNLN